MDVYQRRRLVALSILAGIFVIVVVLIQRCGDDEETPTTLSGTTGATGPGGPTSLSQNDFIDQGDATCLESNTALAAVDEDDPVLAATEEGQILNGQLGSLQELPPPTDGENKLDNFLSALQDQVAAYDRYVTALERGDDTAAAELEAEIDDAGAEARRAARRFGFEVCGDLDEVGEATGGEEATTEGAEEATGGAVEAPPTEVVPVEPAEPVAPAPTVPVPAPEPAPAPAPEPAAPPAEGGGATPEPAPAPPTDGGGGTGSGGVSP
jgi:hypothetical protein